MKICTSCGITKSLDAFGAHKSSKDGKRSTCKPCRNAKAMKDRDKKTGGVSAIRREQMAEARALASQGFKKCRCCGVTKPVKDYHRAAANHDGTAQWCKSCKLAGDKGYREANRERLLEAKKRYRQENRELVIQGQKRWYRDNKEKHKERMREWSKRNAESIRKRKSEYRSENIDVIREREKQLRIENRDKFIEKDRLYYIRNKDKKNAANAEWRKRNPKRARDIQSAWREMNRGKYRASALSWHHKNKHHQHIASRLALRSILRNFLRLVEGAKYGRTHEILGYTPEMLMQRLECQFKPGMSWKNHGEWHIDHKIPISRFISKGEERPHVVNALSNLQPLWANENMMKGNRWIG